MLLSAALIAWCRQAHWRSLLGTVAAGITACAPVVPVTPAWQRALAINRTLLNAMTTDEQGNVYVVGSFSGPIALDSIALTPSNARTKAVVAKWSPRTRRFVWAYPLGDTQDVVATAICVSEKGQVYITGEFYDTLRVGPMRVVSAGRDDVYVAKLADEGPRAHFVWAQRAGGLDMDRASGLAMHNGQVYVTGFFNQTADFGTTRLQSAGRSDVFVAKLADEERTARFVWAQQAGGPGHDQATAMGVRGPNLYLAGEFEQTVQFGALPLTSQGYADIFTVKLVDQGASARVVWAQRAGSAEAYDRATALAVQDEQVYLAGSVGGSHADFGSVVLADLVDPKGSTAAFVAKLTDAGSTSRFAWAQTAGGLPGSQYNRNEAQKLVVDGTTLYVAGYFTQTLALGAIQLTTAQHPQGGHPGNADVFVAKLHDTASEGRVVWAQRVGGSEDEKTTALARHKGQLYVSGSFFSDTLAIGSYRLVNPPAVSLSAFLATLTNQ